MDPKPVTELKHALLHADNVLRCKQPLSHIPAVFVSGLILSRLDDHGDEIILIDGQSGERLTAKQVKQTSLRLASVLQDLGIKAGDVICVICPNSAILSCFMLACASIGAALTGVYADEPINPILFQAQDSESVAILCHSTSSLIAVQVADQCRTMGLVMRIDELAADEEKETSEGKAVVSLPLLLREQEGREMNHLPDLSLFKTPAETIASISYTSGSTGVPKGCLQSHENIIASLILCEEGSDFYGTKGCVYFTTAPPVFDMAITHSLSAMYFGYALLAVDGFPDNDNFMATVQRFGVTDALLSALQTTYIARSGATRHDVKSLKRIVNVNLSLAESIVSKIKDLFPGVVVQQNYGTTEVGVISFLPADCKNQLTVGRPHLGVSIKIVDEETGEALGAKEEGEILVKTASQHLGYHNREDALSRNFTSDGWFMTGDMGSFDAKGLLFVSGRLRDVIKFATAQQLLDLLTHDPDYKVVKSVYGGGDVVAAIVPRDFPIHPDYEADLMSQGQEIVYRDVMWLQSVPKLRIRKGSKPRWKGDLFALR